MTPRYTSSQPGGSQKPGSPRATSPFFIARLLLAVLALWLLSGLFWVGQGEQGVVLRLGQHIATVGPGLHWHSPFPTGRAILINTEQLRTLEAAEDASAPSYLLTRDRHLVAPRFGVQYQITDPVRWLLGHRRGEQIVLEAAAVGVRQAVAATPAARLADANREPLERLALRQAQELLRRHDAGITLHRIRIHTVDVPPEVAADQKALAQLTRQQERELAALKAAHQADLARARTEAAQARAQAETEADRTVAQAQSEAAYLEPLLAEYARSPAIVRERLLQETLAAIGRSANGVVVNASGGSVTVNLGASVTKSTPATPPATPPATATDPGADSLGRERDSRNRERGERP